MIASSSLALAREYVLRAYHDAVALAYSNDRSTNEAEEAGLAAFLCECINQLQKSPGIIECPDLLMVANSLGGFKRS